MNAAAELVSLGRSGLRTSQLGLGLASIGGLYAPVPDSQAKATINRAWELGIRLFDTAPVYGYGRSEQRSGAALRGRPRDAFVLCTKVGRLIERGGPETQPIWADPPPGLGARLDYSYGGVFASVEQSLSRLGMDRVDVLHIHDPELDYGHAVTETYRALAELRGRGTIGAISLGVNHADVAARFLREAPAPGPDLVLLAGRYNLLDQTGLDELLPLCRRRGVAVIGAGVLAGGLLAGTPPTGTDPRLVARVSGIRAVCRRYDVEPEAAALRFTLGHPAIPVALVGARSPAEIEQSVRWLDAEIPPRLWADLRGQGLIR
jgi:D-threo-aldose 1-dehydrogenase